jgi:hypothetical protein
MLKTSKTKSFSVGQALFGLAFVVAGLIIGWEGLHAAGALKTQFAPYLPFSLPPDIGLKTQKSLPFIFVVFVKVVSSLCAVIIGLVWIVSGLGEMIGSVTGDPQPDKFKSPDRVAEALRNAEAPYWQDYAAPFRMPALYWERARSLDPISYQMIKQLMISSIKVIFLGILVALAVKGLSMIPMLLAKYLQVQAQFSVPKPTPLYLLIFVVLIINGIIFVTQLPLKKKPFNRKAETFKVYGKGSPNLFFALFEEGCKLLNPKGLDNAKPTRLQWSDKPQVTGALVESCPANVKRPAGIAGYFYLPLITIFTVLGFSRLLHFNPPTPEMPYAEFVSMHLFEYFLEVAFAIGLIMTGLYFAEWAKRFLDRRQYSSLVAFCCEPLQEKPQKPSAKLRGDKSPGWVEMNDADPRFAEWAKDQLSQRNFSVRIYWAEAVSQSTTPDGPRFLVQLEQTPSLNPAMARILTVPFNTSFDTEPNPEKSSPASSENPPQGPEVDKDLEWTVE